jgi:ketosteroid isomerase-like protein
MTIDQPGMHQWEAAWVAADGEQLQQQYAAAGAVLPPNQALISGPEAIIAFFSGGFAAIEVHFSPQSLLVADTLAFETGTVKDTERGTGRVVEVCDYAVTWVREGAAWKILFHTWSVPKA